MSRYSVRSKVQRLPIEKISQASANQRMGRCGRVAPGVCIRLYDEPDFIARAEFTQPEILRTNLSSVILQMASMQLGEINDFPLLVIVDDSEFSARIVGGFQCLYHPAGNRHVFVSFTPIKSIGPTSQGILSFYYFCYTFF